MVMDDDKLSLAVDGNSIFVIFFQPRRHLVTSTQKTSIVRHLHARRRSERGWQNEDASICSKDLSDSW